MRLRGEVLERRQLLAANALLDPARVRVLAGVISGHPQEFLARDCGAGCSAPPVRCPPSPSLVSRLSAVAQPHTTAAGSPWPRSRHPRSPARCDPRTRAPWSRRRSRSSHPTRQIFEDRHGGGEECLDGSGQEGHCEGASASALGPKSLKHSPHRIGNVNRMHRRPQVSRSNAVTRRARRPGIVTEAPHGASRLTEAGARGDICSLPVQRGAAERRAHDGRPRGQTTSARTGAAAAGR